MAEETLFRLRVRYVKHGRIRHLSHLEVLRALERCVFRSGLPYAVTQGFSPHMRLAFGPALPVGVASDDEWFDLIMGSYVDSARCLASLAAAAVPDLAPLEAAFVPLRAESLSSALTISTYAVEFAARQQLEQDDVKAFADTLRESFRLIIERGSLEVTKGNGKVKTVDLARTVATMPEVFIESNTLKTTFSTRSSNDGSLRPDVLVRKVLDQWAQMSTAERLHSATSSQAVVSSPLELRHHITRTAQYFESEDGTWLRPI